MESEATEGQLNQFWRSKFEMMARRSSEAVRKHTASDDQRSQGSKSRAAENQHQLVFSTSMKASWGIFTVPIAFIRFLPSFCFSRSLRLRVMSPP